MDQEKKEIVPRPLFLATGRIIDGGTFMCKAKAPGQAHECNAMVEDFQDLLRHLEEAHATIVPTRDICRGCEMIFHTSASGIHHYLGCHLKGFLKNKAFSNMDPTSPEEDNFIRDIKCLFDKMYELARQRLELVEDCRTYDSDDPDYQKEDHDPVLDTLAQLSKETHGFGHVPICNEVTNLEKKEEKDQPEDFEVAGPSSSTSTSPQC